MNQQNKIQKVLKVCKEKPSFFAKKFLIGKDGNPLILEPQQKYFVDDKNPYKIFFASRRSGKSVALSVYILHNLFFNDNYNILVLSPTGKQSKELAQNFNDIIVRSPLIRSSIVTNNKLEKSLTNLSRVTFATSGTASGSKEDSAVVGTSPDILLCDELQSIPDSTLGTILPAAIGQQDEMQIVFAGTPRGRTGTFYESIQNSKFLTEYYNEDFLKLIKKDGQFSLHKFQITQTDEDGNVLFSRSPRVTVDELEMIKQTIGLEKFRREFELAFLDSSSMVFYENLVKEQGCLNEPIMFGTNNLCVGGIDLGKQRNNSVLSIAQFNPETNIWEMAYIKRWELGTKYRKIIHYIQSILPQKFPQFRFLCVDRTGVGNVFIEDLEDISRFVVEGVIFSQPSKVGLVESTIKNLESDYLRFYPHKTLVREMGQYTRELTDNDNIIYTKGESDDFVDSMLLCNHAISLASKNGFTSLYNGRPRNMLSSLGLNAFSSKNKRKYSNGNLKTVRLNRNNKGYYGKR